SLWMFYGSIYAAKQETYERIRNTLSDGIKEVPDVVFSETQELGRVNKVDPLGITHLRISGLGQIVDPSKVVGYLAAL
ncbi:NgoPII family restriction endonuclease, partial [Francisella tularensis]|uniref:NgoPII family restriction endonuclease n=1 Tax=Francisella tularensis TaxID=263 RepID=UPI002381A116